MIITPPVLPEVTDDGSERSAVQALAAVRKQVVDYYLDKDDDDWRTAHARSAPLTHVVAGLIADATAIDALHEAALKEVDPLRQHIKELTEELAESKRPFSAQMAMQNNRIIGLNAEIDRLTFKLALAQE